MFATKVCEASHVSIRKNICEPFSLIMWLPEAPRKLLHSKRLASTTITSTSSLETCARSDLKNVVRGSIKHWLLEFYRLGLTSIGLFYIVLGLASRLEAIASRLEAIATNGTRSYILGGTAKQVSLFSLLISPAKMSLGLREDGTLPK